MSEAEKQRVEAFSNTAHYTEGIMVPAVRYAGSVFLRHMKRGGSVLELGPAKGRAVSALP